MTANLTVEALLMRSDAEFTRAERQLAAALLSDYPVSGLASITAIAQNAGVSTPTVARMVKKLGFGGFAAFQDALRAELSAMISGPITRRGDQSAETMEANLLNRFADAVAENLRQTLAQIDPAEFDAAARLLSDTGRKVYVAGGRITGAVASYLFTHLQVARPSVTELGATPGLWPHHVLEMAPGDALVVFDIRRYENALLRLAELAAERGVQIVLFTDQWGSPIGKLAQQRFACRVTAPSPWDSCATILALCEALIAAIQEADWERSKTRMESLDAIFDRTRLFRKFV